MVEAPDTVEPTEAAEPNQVPVLMPDTGRVEFIDAARLGDAVAGGGKPLGKDEALQQLKSEYMGGGVGKLATAGAGYLRGLSGGLSDLALDRTGELGGSDLKQLAETNPYTSGLGHLAGLVGGLAAGGEGEAAAGAAGAGELGEAGASLAGGLPGITSKLGGLAEELGTQLGGKAAGTFARGAAEAVPFTVADNLTEDVFDNKELTAQSLMAHTGTAALLGGGLGVGFEKLLGIAKTALPKSLEAAGSKLEELKAWDEARAPEVKAGKFAETVDGLAQAREDLLNDAAKVKGQLIEQELAQKPAINQPLHVLDQVQAHIDALPNGSYKSSAQEAWDAAADVATGAKTAHEQFEAMDELRGKLAGLSNFDKDLSVSVPDRAKLGPIRDAFGTTKASLEDAATWGKAADCQRDFNERLSPFLNDRRKGDFVRNFFSKAYDSADQADAVLGKAGDQGKALRYLKAESTTTPEGRNKAQALREDLDNALKQTQDLHEFTTTQAKDLATGGTRVRDVKAAVDALSSARAEGIKAAGPSSLEWLDRLSMPLGLRGPIGWVGRLTKQGEVISRVAGQAAKVSKAVAEGVRSALSGVAPKGGAGVPAAAIAHWMDLDALAAHNADPTNLIGRVAQNTSMLQQHAPQLAAGVQGTVNRALPVMSQLAPKSPVPPSGLPGEPKYEPSQTELEKYQQAAEVVERPLSILDRARDGTLMQLHVDVVAQVWPDLYAHMVKETTAALSEHQEPLSYDQRLMLGTLLRRPVGFGQTTLPQMFAAPPAPAPEQPQGPRAQRPSKTGMGKLAFAGAAATTLGAADKSIRGK